MRERVSLGEIERDGEKENIERERERDGKKKSVNDSVQ